MPTLLLKYPCTPPPTFTPRSFDVRSSKKPPTSLTRLRIKPSPPDPYGRTPTRFGELTSRLAITVVTLLSPNPKLRSPAVSSKKLGDHPKSTSKPTTPGFHPTVAPKSIRRSTSSSKVGKLPKAALPPKLAPTKGVKNQSWADAVAGSSASDSALIMNSFLTCIVPPSVVRQ